MSAFRSAYFLGLIAIVVGVLASATVNTCRAEEPSFCWWRPMSQGYAPFRAADAASAPGGFWGAGPAGADAMRAMRIEIIKSDKNARYATTVTSTGSRFELAWPLICAQRLPIERDLAIVRFQRGGMLSIEQPDDFTCHVEYSNSSITYMGDSSLIIKAKTEMTVDFLVLFKPEYQAQQGGSVLAMDSTGGIGVCAMNDDAFRGQKRPTFWGDFGMSFKRDDAGRAQFEPNADRFLVDVALLSKNQLNLLYTGEPYRCACRNNRYFVMAAVGK